MNTETNKIIEQAKKDGWVIICGEPSVNDYLLSAWDPKGRLRLKQRIKNHNAYCYPDLIDMILKYKSSENNTEEEIIQNYIKNGSKGHLDLSRTSITSLPNGLKVGGEIYR